MMAGQGSMGGMDKPTQHSAVQGLMTQIMAANDELKVTPTLGLIAHRLGRDGLVWTAHGFANGVMQAGSPVNAQQRDELIEGMGGGQHGESVTWVDDSIIATGSRTRIWWRAAMIRPMYFVGGSGTITYRVKWPALVFSVVDGRFRVFAHAGQARPDQSTPLYHAPLGNFYSDGRMCFGSVRAPSLEREGAAAFEAAVYDTRFSHPNHAGWAKGRGIDQSQGSLSRFWARRDGGRGVTKANLSPANITVGELLR